MANDGSVEIKITGSVDASVSTSAAEVKSQMAGVADGVAVSARQMAVAMEMVGGNLRKITPEIMAAAAAKISDGAATAVETTAVEANTVATTAQAAATTADTAATVANTGAHISSRAATESLVLVHEALQGRYTRMAGSAMILTQALAGQGVVASVVSAAMTPLGITAIALTATLGYLAYREYEVEKASNAMAEAFALTGRGAENSSTAVRGEISSLEDMSGVSRKMAEQLIAFDAAHADVNARISDAANQLIPQFVKAFGDDGPEAVNKLKTSLTEIENSTLEQSISKFNALNNSLLGLKPAEVEIIEGMIQAGDQIGAVNRILADLAAQGGGHIDSLNQEIVNTQKELEKAKQDVTDLSAAASMPSDPQAIIGIEMAAGKAAQQVAQLQARLKQLQAAAAATPEHGETYQSAFANSHATLRSLRDSASRAKDAVAELHREMEQRRSVNPQDKEVVDYYKNQGKVDRDLLHKEDPGDFKKPKAGGGPGVVSQWTEQLHAQEIASGDLLKDQTAQERDFWQGKLALVKAGSKDYLEIRAKIFEADKKLAKENFDQRIADLNEQLEVDHDNWSKEKADWDKKLELIKEKLTDQSTTYKNAYRDFERAQREHEDRMRQIEQQSREKAISDLKSHLAAVRTLREEQGKNAILENKTTSSGPFDNVREAAQAAALHRQIAQEEIADAKKAYDAENTLREQSIAAAAAKYAGDKTMYQGLLDEKIAADQKYEDQKRIMEEKAHQQALQDLQTLQNAYHGYIDNTVGAMVSGTSKMIGGTENFSQAAIGVYNALVQTVEQQITRMVANWIVQQLTMTAIQRTHVITQTTTHAAGETAKTAATTVGTEARVAATASGAAQTAAVTGLANKKEIGGHAATAAAAAYKAMAGIPVVGPVLGAAAAAATFVAVMAFQSLASLDQGTNYVPSDMVAQIHQGERIIPAADNKALMNAISNTTTTNNAGTNHLHYSPTINAPASKGLSQLIQEEGSALHVWFERAMRDGKIGAR